MTNYIVDKDKLKEILLSHKSFVAKKCQALISKGIDIRTLTYLETNKFTDEFIENIISNLPVESILDQIDQVMKQTVGYTSREMMDMKEHKEKGGNGNEHK